MNVNQFLAEYASYMKVPGIDREFKNVMPRIICVDGFNLSVQASETHYCTPRVNRSTQYSHVEVGYPSEVVGELIPYMESTAEDYLEMQDSPYSLDSMRDFWKERIEAATRDGVYRHGLNTVYPWTPVEIVDAIIASHGGIDVDAVENSISSTEDDTKETDQDE